MDSTDASLQIEWLAFSILWGTLQLSHTRKLGRDLSEGGEDDWTFGQILPVILLAPPLVNLYEYLAEGSSHGKHLIQNRIPD